MSVQFDRSGSFTLPTSPMNELPERTSNNEECISLEGLTELVNGLNTISFGGFNSYYSEVIEKINNAATPKDKILATVELLNLIGKNAGQKVHIILTTNKMTHRWTLKISISEREIYSYQSKDGDTIDEKKDIQGVLEHYVYYHSDSISIETVNNTLFNQRQGENLEQQCFDQLNEQVNACNKLIAFLKYQAHLSEEERCKLTISFSFNESIGARVVQFLVDGKVICKCNLLKAKNIQFEQLERGLKVISKHFEYTLSGDACTNDDPEDFILVGEGDVEAKLRCFEASFESLLDPDSLVNCTERLETFFRLLDMSGSADKKLEKVLALKNMLPDLQKCHIKISLVQSIEEQWSLVVHIGEYKIFTDSLTQGDVLEEVQRRVKMSQDENVKSAKQASKLFTLGVREPEQEMIVSSQEAFYSETEPSKKLLALIKYRSLVSEKNRRFFVVSFEQNRSTKSWSLKLSIFGFDLYECNQNTHSEGELRRVEKLMVAHSIILMVEDEPLLKSVEGRNAFKVFLPKFELLTSDNKDVGNGDRLVAFFHLMTYLPLQYRSMLRFEFQNGLESIGAPNVQDLPDSKAATSEDETNKKIEWVVLFNDTELCRCKSESKDYSELQKLLITNQAVFSLLLRSVKNNFISLYHLIEGISELQIQTDVQAAQECFMKLRELMHENYKDQFSVKLEVIKGQALIDAKKLRKTLDDSVELTGEWLVQSQQCTPMQASVNIAAANIESYSLKLVIGDSEVMGFYVQSEDADLKDKFVRQYKAIQAHDERFRKELHAKKSQAITVEQKREFVEVLTHFCNVHIQVNGIGESSKQKLEQIISSAQFKCLIPQNGGKFLLRCEEVKAALKDINFISGDELVSIVDVFDKNFPDDNIKDPTPRHLRVESNIQNRSILKRFGDLFASTRL